MRSQSLDLWCQEEEPESRCSTPIDSLPDRNKQVRMQVLGTPDHWGELAALLGRGLCVSLFSLACFTQLEA